MHILQRIKVSSAKLTSSEIVEAQPRYSLKKVMFETISSAEKEYIRAGCDVNVRFDGRGAIESSLSKTIESFSSDDS